MPEVPHPPFRLAVPEPLPEGGWRIRLSGTVPEILYSLERSPDLENWEALTRLTADSSELIIRLPSQIPDPAALYFRARQP